MTEWQKRNFGEAATGIRTFGYQLWQGLDRRIFDLAGGWFNGAFERPEDGWRIRQAYSIPVQAKGYCDVEISFDKITVSAKRKRKDALERSYEKLMLHTMAENSLFIRQLSA